MTNSMSLSVIVPALNEEQNLRRAVTGLIKVLEEKDIDWEMILVNDGSTDRTGDIAVELANAKPRIKVMHHPYTMGIGCSFQDGIKAASKKGITWFPGDGENDPNELLKYFHLLQNVDIIVPFVINREIRSWRRRFVSKVYLLAVNLLFGTMFNYTTGNVIYHRRVFNRVKFRANGFTYQTECLVKAVRAGFTFAEVPVLLSKRAHGRSKILTFKSIFTGLLELSRLFIEVYTPKNIRRRTYDKRSWQDTQERAYDERL